MVKLQVCRGMMCSSYGGGRRLESAFEEALKSMGLDGSVEMIAPTCMGSCDKGPCVKINGQKFFHINPEDVTELIRNEIMPLL